MNDKLQGTREATDEDMKRFLEEMEQAKNRRKAAIESGKPALLRLCEVAQGGSGQCHHVRRFLLGLYNSHRWPFELNRLRNLDSDLQDACLKVLEMDFRGGDEVHTYIKNGDDLWRSWWEMEDHED